MQEAAKRILFTLLGGALFGMVATLLVAPQFLEWLATPVVPTACPCTEAVGWGLARLRNVLLLMALLSAVALTVFVEVFRVARRRKDQAPA